MKKFKKLVQLGPMGLEDWAEKKLEDYAEEIIRYDVAPSEKQDIIDKIADAEAVLVRPLPVLDSEILASAKNLRYVGMCCSLYSKESANVDIQYAEDNGIVVKGIRDYGDHGVTEYVIYQLVALLNGYMHPMWGDIPREITGLKVGFVGFGTSGAMTADALQLLGAEISYFARAPKPEKEALGMSFKPLHQLLEESEVIITCLNKNVILLHEEEFEKLGNGKIMFNTSIGPASDMAALKKWIENPDNIFCSDTEGAIGTIADEVLGRDNVFCVGRSAGMTKQSYTRLSEKSLANIEAFFEEEA